MRIIKLHGINISSNKYVKKTPKLQFLLNVTLHISVYREIW